MATFILIINPLPEERWIALQIEHELYCHGHLIEACLSHDTAYPTESLLPVANKAANLICDTFFGPARPPSAWPSGN